MSIQNLNGIKYTEQTLTSAQQEQARQNIGADGGDTVQKIVSLNKSVSDIDYFGGATEVIMTNTTVPGSVFTAVQNSNVTKVWMPRATYDLAVVDANWSTYASKLFPYDFLSFGPDNYVIPVALS